MKKPKELRLEIFEQRNCSFFDDLHTMMIALSSLILISEVFHKRRSPVIEIRDEDRLDKILEIPFQGLTINEDYSYKVYKPLKAIVENIPINRIEFNVYASLKSEVENLSNSYHIDQPPLFNQKTIGSAFVNFYETIKPSIEAKFTQNTNSWPSELNFARVIRNAYSHGGNIHFANNLAPTVSWKSLTYSPSDNGKSIHTDIYLVEVIELMKEIQKNI